MGRSSRGETARALEQTARYRNDKARDMGVHNAVQTVDTDNTG